MKNEDKQSGFYLTDNDIDLEADLIINENESREEQEIPVQFINKDSVFEDEEETEDAESSVNKTGTKIWFVIAGLVAVFVAVICLFPSVRTFFRDISAISSVGRSAIMDIDSDSVVQFEKYAKGIVALTDATVKYSGREKNNQVFNPHSYINPAMSVDGDYIIVYDRGKMDYRLEKDGRLMNTSVCENKIITCDINKKGCYALAFTGKNCTSILSVFNRTSKEVFRWECSDYYISNVSVSPNGQKIAVVLIKSQNGSLSSVVKIFDINYNSEYASFDISDVIVSSDWFCSSKLMIVGKNGVYCIKKGNISTAYSFSDDSVEYYSFSDKMLYLLTLSNTDSSVHNVICIKSNGTVKSIATVTGKPRGFSSCDKYATVLTSDRLITVNSKGSTVGDLDNLKYTVDVVSNGGYNFVLGVQSVKKYSAYGSSHVAKEEQVSGIDQIEKG